MSSPRKKTFITMKFYFQSDGSVKDEYCFFIFSIYKHESGRICMKSISDFSHQHSLVDKITASIDSFFKDPAPSLVLRQNKKGASA